MQLTCIEFARHVLGLEGANSAELAIQKQNFLSLISCVIRLMLRDMGEPFVWDFIHLS